MSAIPRPTSTAFRGIYRAPATTGTPAAALATSPASSSSGWKAVVDALLEWRNHAAAMFNPDDVPTSEVIESAIDFATDMMTEGVTAIPQSITPTGNGWITFQWLDGQQVMTIEILGKGKAELTEFNRGKLRSHSRILRNPSTRRLELQG